jgi:hypothetical protein
MTPTEIFVVPPDELPAADEVPSDEPPPQAVSSRATAASGASRRRIRAPSLE